LAVTDQQARESFSDYTLEPDDDELDVPLSVRALFTLLSLKTLFIFFEAHTTQAP
jgi:hypothetical protein